MQDTELLTVEEAAQRLKVSRHTLNRWRVEGQGPPYLKYARVVRYVAATLDAWLIERTRRSTRESRGENDAGSGKA